MRFLFNIILDVIDNYLSSFQKKKKFEFLSFFFFTTRWLILKFRAICREVQDYLIIIYICYVTLVNLTVVLSKLFNSVVTIVYCESDD